MPHLKHLLPPRLTALVLGVLLALCASSLKAASALQQEPDPLGEKSLGELITAQNEMRQRMSTLKSEWAEGKRLLESRVALRSEVVNSLEERLSELTENRKSAREAVAGYDARATRLAALEARIAEGVDGLRSRIVALSRYAPRAARPTVDVSLKGLGLDPEGQPLAAAKPTQEAGGQEADGKAEAQKAPRVSLSQRTFASSRLLKELNRIHRELIPDKQLITLSEGQRVNADVLWLGLGMAIYATPDGSFGGVARPGPAGWQWIAHNDYAARLRTLIDMSKGKADPIFLEVPAVIVKLPEAL